MGLVNMKEMLIKAKNGKYAVGAFNINNVEWTEAILDECQANNAPVILGCSTGAAKYMGGWNTVVGIVKGLLEDHKITIPVALHLDHGESFEDCKKAIDAGFTSVMIDASKKTFEDNLKETRKVVEYAHARNVSVEAELGKVGGQEENIIAELMYADPQECAIMARETGIDCLAPALGSVHGPYKGEPKLGFKEMEEVKELTNLPLVLHGGSGIPDYQIKKAIECGTAKINVNTECQQAWTAIVREVLSKDSKVYDPRKIIGPGKEGIRLVVRTKIGIFGTKDKA
ncbi:MAG: class II fructose-1,6-bisphosphate aldolase [Bacilli bacterium]|nr:class II fructose-1,6-bisphosphate aldolase [Bacilli bacterium]